MTYLVITLLDAEEALSDSENTHKVQPVFDGRLDDEVELHWLYRRIQRTLHLAA